MALSYIRARAPFLGIAEDFFDKADLHIHVPAGSIPKDGPSAGVALLCALVSLLSNRPIKKDLAMTGEITLRGHVLPVGGIKNKILAADRAGIKEIILPAQNQVDLEEIPPSVREELTFHLGGAPGPGLGDRLPAPGIDWWGGRPRPPRWEAAGAQLAVPLRCCASPGFLRPRRKGAGDVAALGAPAGSPCLVAQASRLGTFSRRADVFPPRRPRVARARQPGPDTGLQPHHIFRGA